MWEPPRPTATLRRMNARLRTLVLLVAAIATLFAVAVGPAMATESAPAGEESGKITLPETSHDRVGLILLGVFVVMGLGGLANASRQLKGQRPQADGRIRWR